MDEPFAAGEDDDGTNDTIDPINEGDEILDELEHEEFPEAPSPPWKRRFAISNTLIGPSTSSLWAKLKDALDPHTSPETLEAYVPHYRYMPIFSGVVIPFSILLEIPGLTEDWYIRTENHETVDIQRNTTILDLGLGFSIAFAALANICLVIRFMEKRVKSMTILCISFLTIHDVLNIITVTTFGVEHRFDDGFTYGQAFWMTVCSTSVSTFTNISIIVDFILTPDFASSGSGLTRKQRTLVISVMVLLTYLAFGALVQTFLDNLSFLDSLYFTVVTIETVGFGDITPKSAGARVFACLYSVFGILSLALTVGLTRETVLEAIEVGYRRRVKAVRRHRRTMRFERHVVKRWNAAIEWRLRRAGLPLWVPNDRTQNHENEIWHQTQQWLREHLWPWWKKEKSRYTKYLYGHAVGHAHPRGMHLNLESLSWAQLEAAAMEAGVPLFMLLPEGFRTQDQKAREVERVIPGVGGYLGSGSIIMPLTHARLGKMIMMLGNFALAVNDESFIKVPKPGSANAKTKRKKQLFAALRAGGNFNTSKRQSIAEQYESLRITMADEERKAFWVRFWLVWFIFLVFWFVGSAIFRTTENWTFGEAMYFCFISFTTIGYGDLTPVTPAGRSVFVFWALLGIAAVTILISILSEAYSSRYKSIFTSNRMTQAIKRYQQRARDVARERHLLPSATLPLIPTPGLESSTTCVQPNSPLSPTTLGSSVPLDIALSDLQKRVSSHLEALPTEVLKHARTFGEEAQYLIDPNVRLTQDREGVPEGLRKLMDDVAGVERLGERIKEEILRDDDARHALLAISIENVLQKIEEIAEEAINAVKERDRLKELQTVDVSQQTGSEFEETKNVRCRHSFLREVDEE
ncbi:Outward-rectifier potassium channel TOK1 [Termitomyces sp. J132]|nr:Outward-rectifier potassium channel TOK1 [Termitomyces sp. J132]